MERLPVAQAGLSVEISVSHASQKKQANELKCATSQLMRGIQTNGVVSHFCKQICSSDIWYYEKGYAASIWDLVIETGWEKNCKNSCNAV